MSERFVERRKRKKRKPPWILGTVVFGLLLFLFMLQSSNVWKNITVSGSGETLLLYALSSLNFVAFIVFGLVLARNLIKLRQERKAHQLGSKLKRRLLIYFAGLTILPLIAMAVFSYLFMNRALERWFTQMPENVVREAGKLQLDTAEDQKKKANQTVQMIAQLLKKTGTNAEILKELRVAGNLEFIEIMDNNGRSILSSSPQPLNGQEDPELVQLKSLIRKGELDNRLLSDGIGYDAVLANLDEGKKILIIPSPGPKGDVGVLVNDSLNRFDDLKSSQIIVRQLGLTTLGLLTFVLMFASSWAAFYLAKGLTRPIRALAEGADEVAGGNFSHRVDVIAEDELELLVQAFNAMTGTLEENSAELEDRRRYTETILQSLSAGVISFDSENRVTTINMAAIRLLRLENVDFVGFKLSELVNKENRLIFEKLISRSGRIGFSTEQSVLFRKDADGGGEIKEGVTVALAASQLPKKNGTVVVIEDLTELITAQRAVAWQEVARRMAHEIKNPLTPIQLSAERIAKRFKSGENGSPDTSSQKANTERVVTEGTETILTEVASLKSMVDEFSRFARLPDAEKLPLNLADVIKQSVALYEDRQDSASIRTMVDKQIPLIIADGEQLKRVFVNLIDNAIEAFDEGAAGNEIVIKADFEKQRELVRIVVSDNGAGIDPADLNKLFQPYFSTKGRGTGLGLAIVHRIVTEHHGKITVARNNGSGSRFSIELPVVTDD